MNVESEMYPVQLDFIVFKDPELKPPNADNDNDLSVLEPLGVKEAVTEKDNLLKSANQSSDLLPDINATKKDYSTMQFPMISPSPSPEKIKKVSEMKTT